MQLTKEVREDLYSIRHQDLLLYLTLNTAISNVPHFGGIIAFDDLRMKVIHNFNRDDLQWGLDLMDKYPHLRGKWLDSLAILDRESLPLYLERVDELWDTLTTMPGVTTDIAWESLVSNLKADPGTRRSEANAFFRINAAVLASLRKVSDSKQATGTYGITEATLLHTARMLPHNVRIEFLTQEMTELAVSNVDQCDAIIDMVTSEGIVQPAAIRYRLTGALLEEDEQAGVLANVLLKRIDAAALAVGPSETMNRLITVERARHANDLATLHVLTRYLSENVLSTVLMQMVDDFQDRGQDDMLQSVSPDGLERYTSILAEHNARHLTPHNTLQSWGNQSLRVAVAIGPQPVVDYILKDGRGIAQAISERGIRNYDGLMQYLEQATSGEQTTLLSNGVL